MIFDNRRISEIRQQELVALIGNQEENLWIDFKRQDYHKDPADLDKHKREICKDVTAMANAEGGYILVGIREEHKVAQDFFTVDNAASVAESIRDVCLQNIDPRIPNLEVEPYSLIWDSREIDLVVIHIPPSEMRPHGFKWKNSTNFVKRYGDVIREFPVSELIQDLLNRYQPPFMEPLIGQLERQLTPLLRAARRERRNSISSQDHALDVDEDSELIRIMELRFHEDISEEPYYRIFAVPKELNPDAVDTRSEDIRNILRDPPNLRYAGFGVMGILERDMVPLSEGIKGSNMLNGEILLLKNGFLEVRCPLSKSHFQWKRDEARISTEWLYPYVVCEFPVSFLKLVKAIHDESSINSSVFIQQEYHNLTGFMLPRGNPANVGFAAFQDERNVYTQSEPIVSKQEVGSDFVPDHVAYDLVKDVYDRFGLETQWIPAFDENGNFILE